MAGGVGGTLLALQSWTRDLGLMVVSPSRRRPHPASMSDHCYRSLSLFSGVDVVVSKLWVAGSGRCMVVGAWCVVGGRWSVVCGVW